MILMDSLPLISVIVPVYNVEKYLDRCLRTLLNQTYKNIEIVLIDDGSTDHSPQICDAYADKYSNIIAIHKENGGQSSARNLGLKNVNGKYIGFVDSDDWVADDMYEYLYSLLIKYNADGSSIWFTTTHSEDIQYPIQEENISILHGKEILEFHLNEALHSGTHSLCRCLFKKDIVKNMIYLEGFVNEDIPFKFEALSRCDAFVDSRLVKYFYFQGSESTTRGGFKKKDMSLFPMTEKLCEMAKPYGGNIAYLAEVKRMRSDFSILSRIAYYGSICDEKYTQKVIKNSTKMLRKNFLKLMMSPIPITRKIILTAFVIDFGLACKFINLVKKIYRYN